MMDLEKIKSQRTTDELLKFSIINIDKPSGPTSFQVSQFIKDSLNINKTSHFGTLDPVVSGVLPVALGRACRLNEYFIHNDKTYIGIMRLHEDIKEEELKKIIERFIGKITQLPPIRSRVKRMRREREIKSFRLTERNGKDVLFETQVEAGTYIRKLIHDIGLLIGGAHMLELRRIKASIFDESSAVTLYQLDKAVAEYKKGNPEILRNILIPAECIIKILPILIIKKQEVKRLLACSPIFDNFFADKEAILGLKENEKTAVFSDEKFIGCYTIIKKGSIIAKPEFVLS